MAGPGGLGQAARCACQQGLTSCGLLSGPQVFPGGRVLTLASARASDSGSYSCVAVNAVGEDRRDVILHVHSECQALDSAGGRPAAQDGGAGASPGVGCGRSGLRLCLPSCRGQLDPQSPLLECELPCCGQVAGWALSSVVTSGTTKVQNHIQDIDVVIMHHPLQVWGPPLKVIKGRARGLQLRGWALMLMVTSHPWYLLLAAETAPAPPLPQCPQASLEKS